MHAVGAAIRRDLGRLPARQQPLVQRVDLHAERPAYLQRIARVRPPQRHRQIAAGTRRDRTQQIDLGEELQMVARLRRARPHEILVVASSARSPGTRSARRARRTRSAHTAAPRAPGSNGSGSGNPRRSACGSRRDRSACQAGRARARRTHRRHSPARLSSVIVTSGRRYGRFDHSRSNVLTCAACNWRDRDAHMRSRGLW